MQSQWKLLSFKSFFDNFDYMLSLRKTEDFPANFLWRKVGRKAWIFPTTYSCFLNIFLRIGTKILCVKVFIYLREKKFFHVFPCFFFFFDGAYCYKCSTVNKCHKECVLHVAGVLDPPLIYISLSKKWSLPVTLVSLCFSFFIAWLSNPSPKLGYTLVVI